MTRLCGKKRRVERLRRPTLLQYLDDDSSLRGGTTKQSTFLSSTHYAQKIWVNPTNDRFLQVSEFVYITRQQKNKLTEIASGDFVPQSPSQ
jgi:hypothetical protein